MLQVKDLWGQQRVTTYNLGPYWHPNCTGAVESEVIWVQWGGVLNGELVDIADP